MGLSKTEENLIKHLWRLKKAYMKDILEAYPDPKPANTTVATLLKRMQDKGYVAYEKHGSIRYYYPLITKAAYFKIHFTDLIENFFDNSTSQFASFFTKESNLTEDQLKELKKIIDKEIKSKK